MTQPYAIQWMSFIIHLPSHRCKKLYSQCQSDSIIFSAVIGWAYLRRKAWCTNDGGDLLAAGTADVAAAPSGAGDSVGAADAAVRRRRLPAQRGESGQRASAHSDGHDLRSHGLAGGGDDAGGHRGIPGVLGSGGGTGHSVGCLRRIAGPSGGKTGGEPGPAPDDSRHRGLSHGDYGVVFSNLPP